jgi:hypothetical protein
MEASCHRIGLYGGAASTANPPSSLFGPPITPLSGADPPSSFVNTASASAVVVIPPSRPELLVALPRRPTAMEKHTDPSPMQHTVEPSAERPPLLVAGHDEPGHEHVDTGMQSLGVQKEVPPSGLSSHEEAHPSATTGGQLPSIPGAHS